MWQDLRDFKKHDGHTAPQADHPWAGGCMMVTVQLYEERPIGISLPDYVTLTITEADPVVKGQTAASSYKPAVLENGIRVLVPPFIGAGERIIVDTNEITYVRRAD